MYAPGRRLRPARGSQDLGCTGHGYAARTGRGPRGVLGPPRSVRRARPQLQRPPRGREVAGHAAQLGTDGLAAPSKAAAEGLAAPSKEQRRKVVKDESPMTVMDADDAGEAPGEPQLQRREAATDGLAAPSRAATDGLGAPSKEQRHENEGPRPP